MFVANKRSKLEPAPARLKPTKPTPTPTPTPPPIALPERAADRMTREAWADAALLALGQGGVEAIAVEPIASLLGVTKGSFYWHFKNRQELLDAALLRWEDLATNVVVNELSRITDPRERLRAILTVTVTSHPNNRVEVALFGAGDNPAVRAAVDRVNATRTDFLITIFGDLGYKPATAKLRARIAYSAYLGHLTIETTPRGKVLSAAASRAFVDEFLAMLTSD